MFSYVDDKIYPLLVKQNKILTLDDSGQPTNREEHPGTGRVRLLGPIPLPILAGDREITLRWYPFVRVTEHEQVLNLARGLQQERSSHQLYELLTAQMTVNSFLIYGDLEKAQTPLVRLHSCCITGETFGSLRCECGPQLEAAILRIVEEGVGAIVYMSSHEGRGIGLWAKGITYILQDMGQDTYDANRSLNLPVDSRDFSDAAIVLRHFLQSPPQVRLLSNNPIKRKALLENGVAVVQTERLVTGISNHNLRYLHAKKEHGHDLGDIPTYKDR